MNPFLKATVVSLILAGLAAFGWWKWAPTERLSSKPAHYDVLTSMEKDGAPDFSVPRLDGSLLKLNDSKGKLIILNFWASWCDPCVKEFPSLIRLIGQFNGKIVLVALSADENKKDIETFIKAFGLPQPSVEIAWDEGHKIAEKFGVQKIPETFILGPDLKLIRKIVGIEDWMSPNITSYFETLTNQADSTKH